MLRNPGFRMLRKPKIPAMALVAGILIVMTWPVAAGSSTPAGIGIGFPNTQVTANQPFQVNYNSTGLPAGATLYLQRQVAPFKIWQSISKLPSKAGKAEVGGLPIGRYRFRVAWLFGSSISEDVYSFGQVPFQRICNNPNVQMGSPGLENCIGGTLQQDIGGISFSYYGPFFGDEYPKFGIALKTQKTTCRSVSLRYAEYDEYNNNHDSSWVEVVQSKTPKKISGVGPDTIGSMSAQLDGGPWIIEVSSMSMVDLNGSFSCYTASGS
jgi:hypothetical protein